jgi:hypothetical protein
MLLSSSIECELQRRGQGFAGAAAAMPAIAILRGRVERQLRVDAARDVAYRRFMCVCRLRAGFLAPQFLGNKRTKYHGQKSETIAAEDKCVALVRRRRRCDICRSEARATDAAQSCGTTAAALRHKRHDHVPRAHAHALRRAMASGTR